MSCSVFGPPERIFFLLSKGPLDLSPEFYRPKSSKFRATSSNPLYKENWSAREDLNLQSTESESVALALMLRADFHFVNNDIIVAAVVAVK